MMRGLRIPPDHECWCAPPHPTGRVYLGFRSCYCGCLIPRSVAERNAIAKERRQMERMALRRVGGVEQSSAQYAERVRERTEAP